MIVGGTGPRGVVSAASYEARRFGVHSAMPGYEARRRCPQGVFLRGDMPRYVRESRRIFAVFRRFAPRVEGLSLDEAFLDLTGTARLLGPPAAVGRRLREAVREETGLHVSVGIAPVKMVAKIASNLAKPDGLLEVRPEALRDFLEPLSVARLWGVGPVARARLEAAGLRTVGDLARADPKLLRRRLGDFGLRVARLARGEDLREVEPCRETLSLGEENTFADDVSDLATLESAALAHAEAVARRLRRSGLLAGGVILKLKGARRRAPGARGYPLWTRSTVLAEPSDDGEVLATAARGLLAGAAWALPVRLLGVVATRLRAREARQLGLFASTPERQRRERLNRALDALHERFGSDAVRRGGAAGVARAGLSLQIKRGEDGPEPERRDEDRGTC